jgi:hypothetical protein
MLSCANRVTWGSNVNRDQFHLSSAQGRAFARPHFRRRRTLISRSVPALINSVTSVPNSSAAAFHRCHVSSSIRTGRIGVGPPCDGRPGFRFVIRLPRTYRRFEHLTTTPRFAIDCNVPINAALNAQSLHYPVRVRMRIPAPPAQFTVIVRPMLNQSRQNINLRTAEPAFSAVSFKAAHRVTIASRSTSFSKFLCVAIDASFVSQFQYCPTTGYI